MSFKIREAHWEVLLNFLERHPSFAVGKLLGLQGKETTRKLWGQLAQELNSLGFGEKSAEKWQKTWTDLKYNIKKKGARAEAERIKTGGGSPESEPFNTFELRALSLLGGKSFYTGLGVKETGHSNINVSSYSSLVQPTRTKINPSTSPTPFKKNHHMPESTTSKYLMENEFTPSSDDNGASINTKRTIDMDQSNHLYVPTPKKQKKDSIDDAYEKTIDLLKNINETLVDLKQTIEIGFDKIANAISAKETIPYIDV